MKKYISNIKYFALAGLLTIASCVSDDLPNVGDLQDITGPTPFYNVTDVSTSEFDCEDVELWAKYELNFQAGSNLAVNGTQYEWTILDANGNTLDNVYLINKNYPIYELLIEAQKPGVIALEGAIADVEFDIPCEEDAAKLTVLQDELVRLQAALVAAEAALSDTVLENIAALEAERDALPAGTLQDQELIVGFDGPGTYTVALKVTDNLGKSNTTQKTITVNQAIPTIPIPEIGEPGFEDNTLFDGSGDGRDSWRAPSSANWGTVFQINSKSEEGVLPEGIQAAKFPADGTRVGYQEIKLTPGVTYVLSYFSAFEENALGDLTVSIVSTNATTLEQARLEVNTIATRTDTNVGRVDDVFKSHSLTFEAGENESAIILITNSGVESRVDSFSIIVKQ